MTRTDYLVAFHRAARQFLAVVGALILDGIKGTFDIEHCNQRFIDVDDANNAG